MITVLAGCTAAPLPAPTPTAVFMSEEEAFAAAEETYRAFTSRLNELDTADPTTFEPLFDLSSGEFEEADREAYSKMHAAEIDIAGETKILSFEGKDTAPPFDVVNATVCLDVSSVQAIGPNGTSHVDPDRPDIYALTITFVADGDRLLIDSAVVDRETAC